MGFCKITLKFVHFGPNVFNLIFSPKLVFPNITYLITMILRAFTDIISEQNWFKSWKHTGYLFCHVCSIICVVFVQLYVSCLFNYVKCLFNYSSNVCSIIYHVCSIIHHDVGTSGNKMAFFKETLNLKATFHS